MNLALSCSAPPRTLCPVYLCEHMLIAISFARVTAVVTHACVPGAYIFLDNVLKVQFCYGPSILLLLLVSSWV